MTNYASHCLVSRTRGTTLNSSLVTRGLGGRRARRTLTCRWWHHPTGRTGYTAEGCPTAEWLPLPTDSSPAHAGGATLCNQHKNHTQIEIFITKDFHQGFQTSPSENHLIKASIIFTGHDLNCYLKLGLKHVWESMQWQESFIHEA